MLTPSSSELLQNRTALLSAFRNFFCVCRSDVNLQETSAAPSERRGWSSVGKELTAIGVSRPLAEATGRHGARARRVLEVLVGGFRVLGGRGLHLSGGLGLRRVGGCGVLLPR